MRRYVNVHTTSDRVLTFCLFIFAVLNHAGIPRAPDTGSTLHDRKFSERSRTLYELAETAATRDIHTMEEPEHSAICIWIFISHGISGRAHYRFMEHIT
jgi:hypothetical protein